MNQLPLFRPVSTWKPPALSSLPSWAGARRIAVDIETCDPSLKEFGPGPRRNGYIAGVSFAIEDGPAYYLPIRHSEDNLDRDAALAYLRDQAKAFRGDVVGANLAYDLDFLTAEGVNFPLAVFRDVQIADVLIHELQDSYSLHNIALRRGVKGKDEELLRSAAEMYGVDAKAGLYALPGRFVADYAVQDVRLPLELLKLQEKDLSDQNLFGIWNLESKLIPVLNRMRSRGVRVDEQRLEGVEQWSLGEERLALEKVEHLCGVRVEVGTIWQAKVLAVVLNKIGISVGKTKTGKPNIDKDILDGIDHPVADALAWARKVNKLRTTFAKSVRNHLVRGRIHCVLNQMAREGEGDSGVRGARYGRLSSEHPNLQQQPARDEFAARWRSIYVPEEGAIWSSNDYSQQEPRMVTHYAVKAGCTRAEAAANRYRNDPTTDNHQMMADLTGLPRKQAKNIYLGLCYGMGGAKLSDELGLPTKLIQNRQGRWVRVAGDEAQAVLDKFNSEAPFVKDLANRCSELAQRRGYITTILGRRCHFPKDSEGNYDWTHKALNRLIQGSSADQTKAAMVACDDAGFWLQLQVHDELDQSVASKKEADDIAAVMRDCVPMEVPSRVDVEVGPSWGEAA
jgi:DNA polymerase I-like protein with 3'-5' exonuclease and polymerase domains